MQRQFCHRALIAAAWQVKTRDMDESAKSSLSGQFAAALDWWRDAGVDHDWTDAPQSWIAAPALPSPPSEDAPNQIKAAPAEIAPTKPDVSSWPNSFADFQNWWMTSEWLDSVAPGARVSPRGSIGAELMVLVAEPEAGDGDTLLSGAQGRLLDAMLAAMGMTDAAVYRASVLPRAMPHADWAALSAKGLGALACHHISLAAPKRLIVFGSHILPLLGHDPANIPANSAQINHGAPTLPLLALRDLAVLLERPRWKAGVWQSWLDWTQGEI